MTDESKVLHSKEITFHVNGKQYTRSVEARLLLSDFLRQDLGLTGTHVGCEHGVCGACTVIIDGDPVRACLLFAVQIDGRSVTTVEGLGDDEKLHPLQEAFREHHGLQCGFCTPGFLTTLAGYMAKHPLPESDEELRKLLAGNLCRCTGYQNIVAAVRDAARVMAEKEGNQ